MKKIMVLILVMSSFSALADYKCSASKWKHVVGGKYVSLSLPNTFKMEKGQKVGHIEGYELASVRMSYGKVKYVLNGEINCRTNSDCTLGGTVTEIVYGSGDNASGFMGRFRVGISGEGEELITMADDKVLKISCK